MPRHFVRSCVAVAIGALVIAGCSLGSGDSKSNPQQGLPVFDYPVLARADLSKGGTVRLGVPAMPDNFNAATTADTSASIRRILAPTRGSAIRFTNDGGWDVDPDYAIAVEVASTSPLTIDVTLNPEAVWQDGTSITADDMSAYWSARNGSNAKFDVVTTEGWDDISSVKVGKDKFSYTVTFAKPRNDWPLYIYPELPASAAQPKIFNSAFTDQAPPSNGPFKVAAIDRETGTVTLDRNKRWWGKAPALDEVVWRTAAADIQAKAYLADELDAVQLDATTYALAKGKGSIRRSMGLEWTQLTLNAGRGPLKNPDVRRAVALAIDRDAIATDAASDMGAEPTVMNSVVYVPGHRFAPTGDATDFDPAQASALLKKAGYEPSADGKLESKGEPLTLTFPVPSDAPANQARAQRIADDLTAIGITVKLESVPASEFFDSRVVPLDFDVVTFTWSSSRFVTTGDRARFYPTDSAQNFSGQGSKALAVAFDAAIAETNTAKTAERVAAVDAAVAKVEPLIPLAVTPVVMAVRDDLVNFGPTTFGDLDWTLVGFKK